MNKKDLGIKCVCVFVYFIVCLSLCVYKKEYKVKVKQVEAPRFQDSRHMKVVMLSALRTDRLYAPPPKKYSWYSFLLEAESTPGP